MTGEAALIAARLAGASEVFPIPHGDWDSRADVTAESDSITVTVTDRTGSKREYRAEVRLVGSVPEALAAGGGAP